MIEGNLNTTNILLGIMAAVSVLQALVVVGVGVMVFRLYRQTFQAIRDIEQRQIAPLAANVAALMTSVEGILADVKDVTARVTRRTERLDAAVQDTMHSVDETAGPRARLGRIAAHSDREACIRRGERGPGHFQGSALG